MDSESPSRTTESVPEPGSAEPAMPPQSEVTGAATGQGLRAGPLLGLAAACLAGVLGWGLVEGIHPVFSLPEGYEIPSLGAPPEMFAESRAAHAAVAQKNAAVNLAVIGALLALGLAAAEAGLRRRWLPLAAAPFLGLVGGGLAGYVGGHLHGTLIADGSMAELTNVIKVQATMLVPLGLAVGLAMGLVTAVPKTVSLTAVAGAVAGLVAAVAYTLIVSLAFATIATEDLMPDSSFGRFVWTFTAAILLGLIIPGTARK